MTVEGGFVLRREVSIELDSPNEQYPLQRSARSGLPRESDYPKWSPCSFSVRDKNRRSNRSQTSATLARNGSLQSDLGAEARGAADDHARDVIASAVARDNAIGDEEGGGTGMVADDAIGREVRDTFLFRCDP